MKQYIVDTFTNKLFTGNPAAVCVTNEALDEELMKNITRENCLSETAFAVKEEPGRYKIRWFTPSKEIDLCGHATLGTAFVIMNYYEKDKTKLTFDSLSGELSVEKRDKLYELNFPAFKLHEVEITDAMEDAIGVRPVKALLGRDLLLVLDDEDKVRKLSPKLEKIKSLDGLLLHVTARGKDYDSVSRTFAPKIGVAEDPVCGSGHCHIVPYWSGVLNKDEIISYQASSRGGVLYCRMDNDRVRLGGEAVAFSESELYI